MESSVANDTSLLCCELMDLPLETIKSLLSSTYASLFEEQKADFNDEMTKFVRNLASAVESTPGGLEHRIAGTV